ncbi:hypothetical protein [Lysobacter sp. A3-1-A15]|uniref:hypothetical protein n=1 Tax=Novilysobacter viscosus TaxID=3098602 RepID=UPI002EDA0A77
MSLLVVAYASWALPLTELAAWVCLLLLAAMLFTLAANGRRFVVADGLGWLLATSALCMLVFAFIYYEHLWSGFTGAVRATQGRYLYPVVPFLLLLLVWPFRTRAASRAVLCGAVGAMIVADGFFLRQVFQLYGQL